MSRITKWDKRLTITENSKLAGFPAIPNAYQFAKSYHLKFVKKGSTSYFKAKLIRKMVNKGVRRVDIARLLKIPRQRVYQILKEGNDS